MDAQVPGTSCTQTCNKPLKYDVSDRMIDKSLFWMLEKKSGRLFTVDGFSNSNGDNALCLQYCHKDKCFTQFNCEGHHVWMNPPFQASLVKKFLLHYRDCKRRSPHNTSACIMLPHFARRTLGKLLNGWEILHSFPRNTCVVTVPCKDGSRQFLRPGLPFDLVVYHDPVVPLPHTTNQPPPLIPDPDPPSPFPQHPPPDDANQPLQFITKCSVLSSRAGCDTTHALVGFDTLASHCFVAKWLVEAVGAQVKEAPPGMATTVKLGNNSQSDCPNVAIINFSVQGQRDHVLCSILDELPAGLGLILGQPWLTRHRVTMRYKDRTVRYKRNRRPVVLHCPPLDDEELSSAIASSPRGKLTATQPLPPLSPSAQAAVLSALQLKRFLRKRYMLNPDRSFWLMVSAASPESPKEPEPPDPPELKPMMDRHPRLFQEQPPGVPTHGPDDNVEHPIDLNPEIKVFNRPLGRLSKKERDECEKTIKELLEKGYIVPSKSPFGAPILFVGKKDGTLRMCVDYKALNKATVKNTFPLPRVDDLLDMLSGAQYFSALDLASGYHQVRMKPSDVHKTAFRTPMGLYEWKVMPFGLCNAPATFQQAMNQTFGDRIGKFVLVYMDDILVYSKSKEEHLQHLEEVFTLLEEHNYYVKKKKCDFLKTEVKFLGHLVSSSGLRVDPDKCAVVKDWPRPKDKGEIRSLLGFGNYFRRFIMHYSEMVRPLTDLTKSDTPTVWTQACEQAFQSLKDAIVNAPVLKHPDLSKPFTLVCDASNFASGAILMQDGHPCAFASKKFSKAEVNYTTEERELLAVIQALKLFRCYLEGTKFTVCTDHNPLKYFDTKQDLSPRQARWAHYLTRFDYTWQWIKGISNPADFLSRHPAFAAITRSQAKAMAKASTSPSNDSAVQHFIDSLQEPKPKKKVRKGSQRKSRRKQKYSQGFEPPPLPQGWMPPPDLSKSEMRELLEHQIDLDLVRLGYTKDPWFSKPERTKNLRLSNGLYFRGHAIVLPKYVDLRQRVFREFHDSKYSGHFGANKTLQSIKRMYWWPFMARHVRHYVRTCVSCQSSKPENKAPAGLLKPLQIPTRPWSSVSMDLITDLPVTQCGKDAITVVVDRLTKMTHFIPCATKVSAIELAKHFLDNVFRLHGVPTDIVSDRDPRFTSQFWREFCRLTGTKQNLSTPYHPQTDGQTERMNRVLEETLRHFVAPHGRDWIDHLSVCEFAINNSVSVSTGYTPFYLTYGYHPLTPATAVLPTKVPAAAQLHQQMQDDLASAIKHLEAAQKRQKHYADASRRHVAYAEGDMVWLSSANIGLYSKKIGRPKLARRFIGPFKVLQRCGELAYKLELPDTMKRLHNVFHVSRLKPYHEDGRVQPPPPPVNVDGELSYEVEMIYAHREVKSGRGKRLEYLVRWKGYGPEHDEYVPENNFDSMEPINKYWATR